AARSRQAVGRAYFLAAPNPLCWTELRSIASSVMSKKTRVLKIPAKLAYSVGGCAELWSRLTGKPGIVSREKIREALFTHWTCQTGRAAEELGFVARTTLAEGVAASLAWYKEAGWLKY